jgi:hypothetical protein
LIYQSSFGKASSNQERHNPFSNFASAKHNLTSFINQSPDTGTSPHSFKNVEPLISRLRLSVEYKLLKQSQQNEFSTFPLPNDQQTSPSTRVFNCTPSKASKYLPGLKAKMLIMNDPKRK